MRVLLLHNRYRFPGGEERAVADISALLERRGHTTQVLERSSAQLPPTHAARALLRGGDDPGEVAAAVRRLGADVVHVHNVHPLLGWRAIEAARAAGARTILHLHNFRLFCAVAVGYRDGAPCFRCRGRDTLPGLRLRCRGSIPEAAAYAAGLFVQQPKLLRYADRLVTVSDATRGRLVALGVPGNRLHTIPNFVPAARFVQQTLAGEGSYALVAGRLVEEKGFDTAIAAARMARTPLVVAGDGPDRERLQALAAGADVSFTGWLDGEQLDQIRARAAVVLVPSRWEEPCPYAALDALAAGVPVLATARGGLPELVGRENALPADDVSAWAAALGALWSDAGLRRQRGEACLDRARRQFGEDQFYEALMALYSR